MESVNYYWGGRKGRKKGKGEVRGWGGYYNVRRLGV